MDVSNIALAIRVVQTHAKRGSIGIAQLKTEPTQCLCLLLSDGMDRRVIEARWLQRGPIDATNSRRDCSHLGATLENFQTAGSSPFDGFGGTSEMSGSHWTPLSFCAASTDSDRARWCHAVPINAQILKRCVPPMEQLYTEGRKFFHLADVRRVFWPQGMTANSQVFQDLKFSDVAIREKGSELRGRAFPVDCT
jgi:hypothetical protein